MLDNFWIIFDFLNRFFNIKSLSNGVIDGNNREVNNIIVIGKIIFFVLEIFFNCFIFIVFFFLVVRVFIIGGWINGINVIYE